MSDILSRHQADEAFATMAGEAKAEYSHAIQHVGASAVRPEILGDPRMADVHANPHLIVVMNVAQNTYGMEREGGRI